MIVAFEGVDGAGKNTLVNALEQELLAREVPVARVGFPRYETSVHAQLVRRALYQQMGDLTESINGMATLFALDRAEVAEELDSLDEDGYVILLDRYVASNAAYSAARRGFAEEFGEEAASVVNWIAELEFETLAVPLPDLQILVDVPTEVAMQRAEQRAEADEERARDSYEADEDLQHRTGRAYRLLAEANWQSDWHVVDASDPDVKARANALADLILASESG